MQAKRETFHPDERYYKCETLGFEDEQMEADVPFAQIYQQNSFGVPAQGRNSIGYQPMNDYDVQMDDEEETKSVCESMSQLRDNNVMGAQSHYSQENPQSDGQLDTDTNAQDRFENNSWLAMRRNTYQTFDLNNQHQQFTAERNASFDRIQSQYMEIMSAGNGSARKLSNIEAERRRLSSSKSPISQRRISLVKDKITILVDGATMEDQHDLSMMLPLVF